MTAKIEIRASCYRVTITTPFGHGEVEADTWENLLELLPTRIAGALVCTKTPEQRIGIDEASRLVLGAYKRKYKFPGNSRPRLEIAGFELDVVKCYLKKMTIQQTVSWLKHWHNYSTSKTAVGRYFTRLNNVEIAEKFKI